MSKLLFKIVLAALLALPGPTALAQSFTANGCVVFASGLYEVGIARDQGVPIEVQYEALKQQALTTPPERMVLLPLAKTQIDKIYQSKDKSPKDLAQEFLDRCFEVHGNIKSLRGQEL